MLVAVRCTTHKAHYIDLQVYRTTYAHCIHLTDHFKPRRLLGINYYTDLWETLNTVMQRRCSLMVCTRGRQNFDNNIRIM
jgi:hypothetical protein